MLSQIQDNFDAVIKGKRPGIFIEGIIPAGSLTPEDAVGIYAAAYEARLTEALGDTYRTVWRILGDELFFAECGAYIHAHPSASHNLSHYGGDFADFLGDCHPDHAVLRDLAQFEWKMAELFHKKEHIAADLSFFGAIEDDGCRLRFHEHFFLFQSEFSVLSIWRAGDDEQAMAAALEMRTAETGIAYKKNNGIFVKDLTPAQHCVLQALQKDLTLGDAISSARDIDVEQVTALFQLIGHSGLIKYYEPSSGRIKWVQNIS
ncbi:MAG: putative DNA-binding domain-containing protein [Leptospirales bacterium]|nr:putative DNA-binding domain-containing protein [Leptospirales bacterium]